MMLNFKVTGTPAPKGSSRACLIGGKPTIVPNSSTENARKQRSWSSEVATAGAEAMATVGRGPLSHVPVSVVLQFVMVRPSGHLSKKDGSVLKSKPRRPATKPDLDKLVRCTLDALAGIVFDDDSRIVRIVASKHYAMPGEAPGAHITIGEEKT
jgi:Holliday junction resolvase RusA-like endonuclease